MHGFGGDGLMVGLQALLITATLVLVAASVAGGAVVRLLAIDVVLLLALHHVQMRPHLLSWLFLALLMLLLGRRLDWAVPLLLVLWANCHGSVPLAATIATLHFTREYLRSRARRCLARLVRRFSWHADNSLHHAVRR